jgi:ATP-dependent exoDNAse (exonuclease V) alpha subunit
MCLYADTGDLTNTDHRQRQNNAITGDNSRQSSISDSDLLIRTIYSDMDSQSLSSISGKEEYFRERVILAARNVDVDKINEAALNLLPGQSKIYLSADEATGDSANTSHVPLEYLNSIVIPGMALHSITIKIGCPIMLLRNLCPPRGLCNGTRMVITAMGERVIEAKILMGVHKGTFAFLPRISMDSTAAPGLPFTLRRHQYPFRSAFAMTINKSQGQSISNVGVHLLTPVFSHGQLYVALSRVTDCHNLCILLPSNNNASTTADVQNATENIVYKEVLQP